MKPYRHLSFVNFDRWHIPVLVAVTILALAAIPSVAQAAIGNGSGRDVEYDVQPPDPGGDLTAGENSGPAVEYDSQRSRTEGRQDVDYDVEPSEPGGDGGGWLWIFLLRLLGVA